MFPVPKHLEPKKGKRQRVVWMRESTGIINEEDGDGLQWGLCETWKCHSGNLGFSKARMEKKMKIKAKVKNKKSEEKKK